MAEHLSCQEVVGLVTDYLERALPPEDTSLFEEHINFCDGCQWYLDQLRITIATVGRIHEADLPPAARDALMATFHHWKQP